MCNRTQSDAIWGLIALFLTNQIAGNTIDFKMNVIREISSHLCLLLDMLKSKNQYQNHFGSWSYNIVYKNL